MQTQSSTVAAAHAGAISTTISKPMQIAGALLLGTFILSVAGFVQTSAVHNAAHDMRHSQGFPCH